jgi:hypothetical protein
MIAIQKTALDKKQVFYDFNRLHFLSMGLQAGHPLGPHDGIMLDTGG